MKDSELKRIVHIAIIVKNIEKARTVWADLLGVEKPPIVETESWESTHMMFKGAPSKGRAKLSFFNFENVVLEFIQPIGTESTWHDFLEKTGEGLHHIAFEVEDMDKMLDKFKKMGIEIEQKGDFKGGSYVYIDSKNKLGTLIELLHYEK
ncbi:MAG: VOC family protein [Candidatus Bathyarchaeia archaeon]